MVGSDRDETPLGLKGGLNSAQSPPGVLWYRYFHVTNQRCSGHSADDEQLMGHPETVWYNTGAQHAMPDTVSCC